MPAFLAWPVIKAFFGGAFGSIWKAITAFFGSLNSQGWLGFIGCAAIALLWLHTAGEARHWHKQSDQYQKLYTAEKSALDQTKANLLAAATKAKADDAANARRVQAQQTAISERTANDFETRLAAARAEYQRLSRASTSNPGVRGSSPVPGVSAPASGADEATGQDGLHDRLTATEQAIQLDELEKWVRAQHDVNPNEGKK